MAKRIFERTGIRSPNLSAFDLSHEKKLSCNMGNLIPIYLQEVVPGDQFRVSSEIMMRFAPMVSPVMHRVDVFVHYFFVPNRLVWNQWEEFITGGKEGTSTPVFPQVNINDPTNEVGSLFDYLGLPPGDGTSSGPYQVSQLPFRAYTLIWNDYYRDPNLHDEVDHTSVIENQKIRNRCWEKDYFTSALPFAQRGVAPQVPFDINYKPYTEVYNEDGTKPANNSGGVDIQAGVGANNDSVLRPDALIDNLRFENLDQSTTGLDVNELRRTVRIQRWLEKAARGGYRYIEVLLSMFGVKSSDARLQRPEYLGGGKQPVVISEVLNTTGTTEHPQGDMAGHGISVGKSNTFQEQFEEHGYVMGIMSVLPRSSYYKGVPRHWRRFDRFDHPWPEFANLGEQEVTNDEVFLDGSAPDTGVFGYQQRYADLKYGVGSVHGDFRNTLDFWHLGRNFATLPALNESFVEFQHQNFHRIFANTTTTDHKLWVQIYHDIKARRPFPYFADPRL